jgi:hypothetical protein
MCNWYEGANTWCERPQPTKPQKRTWRGKLIDWLLCAVAGAVVALVLLWPII